MAGSSIAVIDPKYPTRSLILSSSNEKSKSMKVQKFCHYLETLTDCHRPLEGDGPLLHGCGYCVSQKERCLYVYGGSSDNKSTKDKAYGGLYKLDIEKFKWEFLSKPDSGNHSSPNEKGDCGILCFGRNVLVIGGYGKVKGERFGWTNEVNAFNIDQRNWVTISLSELPPLSSFTVTVINTNSALLFGGTTLDMDGKVIECSSDLYLIKCHTGRDSIQVEMRRISCDGGKCPQGRFNHAACCLEFNSKCPILVVSGGENMNKETLCDTWMFSLASKTWNQLRYGEVYIQWQFSVSIHLTRRKTARQLSSQSALSKIIRSSVLKDLVSVAWRTVVRPSMQNWKQWEAKFFGKYQQKKILL